MGSTGPEAWLEACARNRGINFIPATLKACRAVLYAMFVWADWPITFLTSAPQQIRHTVTCQLPVGAAKGSTVNLQQGGGGGGAGG